VKLRRAVSIVEVIVALAVFSVAALGSAAALTVSVRAQRNAAARREALSALQAQAETLASVPCATLASGQGVVNAVTIQWAVARSDSLVRVALSARHRGTQTSLHTEVVCE
jgi:prepilin-type N-terminal cleavage/methylation domain-containing protein